MEQSLFDVMVEDVLPIKCDSLIVSNIYELKHLISEFELGIYGLKNLTISNISDYKLLKNKMDELCVIEEKINSFQLTYEDTCTQ